MYITIANINIGTIDRYFFFTLHKSAVFKGFVHCFTAIKAGSSAHCSPQRLPSVSAEGMSGTER